MKLCAVDTETTGLDFETDQITELAAIYRDGTFESTFHEFIYYDEYPLKYDEVAQITGLTPAILKEKGRRPGEVYKLFSDWLGCFIDKFKKEDKAIMIGYNVGFDNQMIRKFFERHNDCYFGSWFLNCRVDVMSMIAEKIAAGKLDTLPNYKLQTVADHFKIQIDAHSGISDVSATLKLYDILST